MTNQRINIGYSIFLFLLLSFYSYSQDYNAGFTSIILTDSSRIFKPDTSPSDRLHHRPVEVDIWYPAEACDNESMLFGELFGLFEERAVRYDDTEDFSGVVNELALYYVAELGMGNDPNTLLNIKTNSHKDAQIVTGEFPLIIYLAGFNGMGFENYKIFENLAQNGYVVASIWSVGRYPGNMTNRKEDMLEQVYDAEFTLKYLRNNKIFDIDPDKTGLLGSSWGGMSAAVLANRLPSVSAFVSLDGTETHYFGENDNNAYYGNSPDDDNDQFIRDIHQSGLLDPEAQGAPYLYLESGNKLDDFNPTGEFHFYKQLQSEKFYLRLEDSKHEDFTCIPSILDPSGSSAKNYRYITEASRRFFDQSLKGSGEFETYSQELLTQENANDRPFEYTINNEDKGLLKVNGAVLDSKTGQPLQYVNVGVLNKSVGTVTNSKGQFELEIPEEFLGDTLKISMIGYKAREWIIEDSNSGDSSMNIALEEQISELDEVVLTAKEYRRKTLGNKTKSKFLGTGFSYDQLGAEMGIRININKPTLVDQFNFHISYNRLSATSVFRLNFYSIKDGKPDTNILREQILSPIQAGQTGVVSINLKPYGIVLQEDVIIALEWVENKGENQKDEAIFFSLGMFNSGTLYKESSQAPFKKFNSMGVGFNLDVRI